MFAADKTERGMDSRRSDNTPPHHQPLLSSLVVRPSDSGGGGGGGAGSDYEPGEVRRDPPPYLRTDRRDEHGHRMRAGSVSPVRHRGARRFSPGFEHSGGGAPWIRGFGRGRGLARRRDYSPPPNRDRFAGKSYDRPGRGVGPPRVEGLPRNNPNVQPREGDWVCSDPSCKNLNFARREHCNNCNKPRYAPAGSPRREYPGPRFPPRQRYPSPPLNRSPRRPLNGGYRSPPRFLPRDSPRDLRAAGPPLRHSGPPIRGPRGDRPDYPEDDPRDRYRHDRPAPRDWNHGDRGNGDNNGGRRYGRRDLSPPLASEVPPRDWAAPIRERSRSPVRGGAPHKDYPRDTYLNRGRDDRRAGAGRGAF